MATNISAPLNDRRDGESRYEAGVVTERAQAVYIHSFAVPAIFLILLFAALKLASEVLIPVAAAFLLSTLFAPVMRLGLRLHVPPPISAALVLFVFVGSVAFGIYQLALPATEWMAKLPQSMPRIEQRLEGVKQSIQKFSKASQEVEKLTDLDSEDEKTQKVEVKRASVGATLLQPTQAFMVRS